MRNITLIILCTICMFVFSCDKKTTEPEPEPLVYSYVWGKIRHAIYGFPLSKVKYSSLTAYNGGGTSYNGRYTVAYAHPGLKEIKFSCYGFVDSLLYVTLVEGDSIQLDINMRRQIPLDGHAFYNPGYPLSDLGYYELNPTTGCADYPDSLVLWSQHLEKLGTQGVIWWYRYYTVTINIAKPFIGGTINLADTTQCFVDYRIVEGEPGFWTTDRYTTRLQGGAGFIYIYNYDPVQKIIEGTHSNISLKHETLPGCTIYSSIFIGHWQWADR